MIYFGKHIFGGYVLILEKKIVSFKRYVLEIKIKQIKFS
jgi:hypothetical protein